MIIEVFDFNCVCMFGYLASTADVLEVAEFAESCFKPYPIIIGKTQKLGC